MGHIMHKIKLYAVLLQIYTDNMYSVQELVHIPRPSLQQTA